MSEKKISIGREFVPYIDDTPTEKR